MDAAPTPEILFVPAQYATLQAAVDAVSGPATIIVSPGLYNEDFSDSPLGIKAVRDRSFATFTCPPVAVLGLFDPWLSPFTTSPQTGWSTRGPAA